MEKTLGWAALLTVGLLLVVLGITGRLGSALAAITSPAYLVDASSLQTDQVGQPGPGGGIAVSQKTVAREGDPCSGEATAYDANGNLLFCSNNRWVRVQG